VQVALVYITSCYTTWRELCHKFDKKTGGEKDLDVLGFISTMRMHFSLEEGNKKKMKEAYK
jgi:hypothetical protein